MFCRIYHRAGATSPAEQRSSGRDSKVNEGKVIISLVN